MRLLALLSCILFCLAVTATSDDTPTEPKAGPDWWSIQPIRRPALPTTQNKTWNKQPIDVFILAKLEANQLIPAPEADRRTYLRRVKYDLLGLPPTPEELQQFENDNAADAYEKLVDRFLASPHYGEHWGQHWLDVVRFAESHGYETNQLRRNAWPFRDWVIRSFNEDKPYSQFVTEQLAGDVVAKGDRQNEVATGFLVAGTHDVVGNETPEGKAQQRQDDLYDMVSATGSTFLGLTLNCARCHDHKFDPILQKDYYSMQAIFAGTQHSERKLTDVETDKKLSELSERFTKADAEMKQLEDKVSLFGKPRATFNTEVFSPISAKFIRMSITSTEKKDEPCVDEIEIYCEKQNVAIGGKATASSEYPNSDIHRIKHINDGQVGNSHSWISNEKGSGWVQIELKTEAKVDRIVWGRDRQGKFADRLAKEYRFETSIDGKQWQLLTSNEERLKRQPDQASTEALAQIKKLKRSRDKVAAELKKLNETANIYCGSFTTPEKTFLLKRGDPMQKREEVAPAALSILNIPLELPDATSESQRRLALAKWITHPKNPLPARVMVNRIWHYHFGKGLVRTPNDFGYNGDKPSHPELLDWLASEFQTSGGKLKPLHKMIVLSATYRQSCKPNPAANKLDADNRLLWQFPRRRLSAEELRDSILSVTGKLDKEMFGPGYDLWKYSNYVVVFQPLDPLPPDAYRRMVYQFKPRTQQDATFGAFDCPDGAFSVPRRNSSMTALQSLNLLNSTFMLDQSSDLAKRIEKEAGPKNVDQVRHAFLLVFGRPPSEAEAARSQAAIQQAGLAAFCRALLNTNEFIFVE